MSGRIAGAARSAVFILILLASLGCINYVLQPKYILKNSEWPTTATVNEFYQMDKDSIDVLFLGSSIVVNDFSPQKIYNEYGITSYNLASEQQSIFLSYFWLKEALRFQSPKAVVLDTHFLFYVHPNLINTTEELTRKCLDYMRWSAVKREAVADLCRIDKGQTEISYYLTNIRFHTRWTSLTEYDMSYSQAQGNGLKGFGPLNTMGPESFEPYTPSGDLQMSTVPQEIMLEYLDKTVALCKENGIALILISLPGSPMTDGEHNMLTAYAQEKNVDYYNLCEAEAYRAIGATLPLESVVGHGNLWGAEKISSYIGRLLSERYGIAGKEARQFEETRGIYEHMRKNCELPYITEICDYLESIADERYTVFLSIRDEGTAALTEPIKERLRALGLQEDLTDKFRWSYCAAISPENGVTELLSDKKVELEGKIRNKRTSFSIYSAGFPAGKDCSIVIDGTEYAVNTRGLNIVVYDNEFMKVVDSICFDTYYDCHATRKENDGDEESLQ